MCMELQSGLVPLVTLALYGFVGVYLMYRGKPLFAGFAMLVVSLLPLEWQVTFTDSDAKGFGILLIAMLPIPLLLLTWGILAPIVRGIHRLIASRKAA
jgi:hypothetical protein